MTEKNSKTTEYLSYATQLVQGIVARQSLAYTESDKSGMGEWYVNFENKEFILIVCKDRSEYVGIELGSKLRRKPRAQMRGPWSMSHLRGYLEGGKNHYKFKNSKDEAAWLEENENKLFSSSLLNSDELNKWAVNVSKRLFS